MHFLIKSEPLEFQANNLLQCDCKSQQRWRYNVTI